jgi:gluconolactonase
VVVSQRRPVAAIFASGLDHPEGLAVAPDGTIWAGGEEGQIYVVTADGRVAEHARTGGFSGGLAFDRSGACFVCNSPGRVIRVEADGRWEVFADSVAGIPMRVPNFPVFGPDGSLYVSDSGSWDVADGVIYRFAPGGSGTVFHGGPFHYTNGLAIDAAGEFLYVVETGRHGVVRLRIDEGSRAVPQPVCRPRSLRWMPDGLALDAAGTLYVTMYASDRIYRIAPGGVPEVLVTDVLGVTLNRPTNCAFGGSDFDRLFVANLGGRHLSVIDLGRPGQPLFGGPH